MQPGKIETKTRMELEAANTTRIDVIAHALGHWLGDFLFDKDCPVNAAPDYPSRDKGQSPSNGPPTKKSRVDTPAGLALVVWMAGACCQDFATYGDNAQECGSRMLLFLIWIFEIFEDLPDVVVFEITAVGTWELLIKYVRGPYVYGKYILWTIWRTPMTNGRRATDDESDNRDICGIHPSIHRSRCHFALSNLRYRLAILEAQ